MKTKRYTDQEIKIKLSYLKDDMIFYVESPKESKNILELISKYNKDVHNNKATVTETVQNWQMDKQISGTEQRPELT